MKHFTYDDRLLIQRGLTLGWSFSRIAAEIGKDRTSISREIRAHLRYDFLSDVYPLHYTFNGEVPVSISGGECSIDFRRIKDVLIRHFG